MLITIEEGTTRCLLTDDADMPEACMALEQFPHRASSIEPVLEGKYSGWWKVDFSPLVNLEDSFNPCSLTQLFRTRALALEAEVNWLKENFLGVQ